LRLHGIVKIPYSTMIANLFKKFSPKLFLMTLSEN
jgi:hypothetical protein